MADYIFAYHGGKKPETQEAGAAMMARWQAWVQDLGEAMVNPGTPVGKSKTVSATGVTDDGGSNPLAGYSVVRAESMDAALAMAKSCPFVEVGTIEVAQMMEM